MKVQPKEIIVSIFLLLSIIFALDLFPSYFYLTCLAVLTATYLFLLSQTKEVSSDLKPQTKKQKSKGKSTEERAIQKELEMAKKVQQGLLSVEIPTIPGVKIARRCIPAEHVGGDFYTFINKEGRVNVEREKQPGVIEYVDRRDNFVGIAIGDVAGHGVSAALIMALSSVIFRRVGKEHKSPGTMLKQANQDIRKYIDASQISYVTSFYCMLDLETKALRYAKAGHVPALWVKKDGSIEELDGDGVFLGMFDNEDYEECQIQLEEGERIILYTDGLIEAESKKGDRFGLDRFKALFSEHITKPAKELEETIFNEIHSFSGSTQLSDDQTLVIIEVE